MEAVRRIRTLEHLKLAIVFVVLNVVDAVLTKVILTGGGIELNPIMRYLFGKPEWVAWTFEIGSTMLVSFGLLILALYSPRFIKGLFIALIALLAFVCIYNGIGLLS